MDDAYFFDTYALVEIVKANPRYARFKHSKIALTVFNLMEFHYKVLRDFNGKIADELLSEYSQFEVPVDSQTIREASEFKILHRSKDLSSADAIGYVAARRLGMKFLTGDGQFKEMPGVEFVR